MEWVITFKKIQINKDVIQINYRSIYNIAQLNTTHVIPPTIISNKTNKLTFADKKMAIYGIYQKINYTNNLSTVECIDHDETIN